jgi:hypothetical protein
LKVAVRVAWADAMRPKRAMSEVNLIEWKVAVIWEWGKENWVGVVWGLMMLAVDQRDLGSAVDRNGAKRHTFYIP